MSSDPQGSEFKKAGLQDDDKKVHVSFIKKDLVVEEGEAKVVSVSAVVPLGQEDPSASPGPGFSSFYTCYTHFHR